MAIKSKHDTRPTQLSVEFIPGGNCKIYKVGGKSAGVDCQRQYVQSLSGMLYSSAEGKFEERSLSRGCQMAIKREHTGRASST